MNVSVDNAQRRAAILRAEVSYDGATEVACALEMSEESLFIITDRLPSIGSVVDLKLSFPQMVDPIATRAQVVQIRLSSGPGAPSGFVATFEPADEAERSELDLLARRLTIPPGQKAGAPGRKLRILFVEDNRLVRDMFAYAVQRYFQQRAGNIQLDQAETSDAAWQKLGEESYDLVIVDYYLPTDDGATLIAKLRRDERLAKTSVVAISVGGRDAREASISAGADIFLHKPIVLKDLFYTLEFLMENGRPVDVGAA